MPDRAIEAVDDMAALPKQKLLFRDKKVLNKGLYES
jgi:hypothetical protein